MVELARRHGGSCLVSSFVSTHLMLVGDSFPHAGVAIFDQHTLLLGEGQGCTPWHSAVCVCVCVQAREGVNSGRVAVDPLLPPLPSTPNIILFPSFSHSHSLCTLSFYCSANCVH